MDITQVICTKYLVFWTLMLFITPAKNSAKAPWKLEQTVGDGPVYTFVKTDKDANIKWGVRHYIPRKTAVRDIYKFKNKQSLTTNL